MVSRSVVLPGDFLASSSVSATTRHERVLGAGLARCGGGVRAVVAGVLNERTDKLWVSSSGKSRPDPRRPEATTSPMNPSTLSSFPCSGPISASSYRRYMPKAGDRVLGVVTTRAGDYFRVDIGGPDLAQLSFLAFEGATKRNKPAVRVGDLVYCQVTLCARNLEPEVSCVDAELKARGMGAIQRAGLIITVELNHARRLLSAEDEFLSELGKEIKFETTIGVNGRIWVSGGKLEVLAVKDAILEWTSTPQSHTPSIINRATKRSRGIDVSGEVPATQMDIG